MCGGGGCVSVGVGVCVGVGVGGCGWVGVTCVHSCPLYM